MHTCKTIFLMYSITKMISRLASVDWMAPVGSWQGMLMAKPKKEKLGPICPHSINDDIGIQLQRQQHVYVYKFIVLDLFVCVHVLVYLFSGCSSIEWECAWITGFDNLTSGLSTWQCSTRMLCRICARLYKPFDEILPWQVVERWLRALRVVKRRVWSVKCNV